MFPGALLDDFGYQIHGAKHSPPSSDALVALWAQIQYGSKHSPPSPDALVPLRAENQELEIRHDIFMKNIDFSMFQGSKV